MGDSFWFLVVGGAEGGQKRLILQPKWKQRYPPETCD